MAQLEGPRVEPRRAASSLVVLLHGYGANGEDLIALAHAWRGRLPDTAFVAPNAPETIPGMYGALQWFALARREPGDYWRGVTAARPLLERNELVVLAMHQENRRPHPRLCEALGPDEQTRIADDRRRRGGTG